jgi:hypothetical protein
MLDRIFAFSALALLGGFSAIAVATSVEVQSVVMLFAALFAFSAVASSEVRD